MNPFAVLWIRDNDPDLMAFAGITILVMFLGCCIVLVAIALRDAWRHWRAKFKEQ